MFTIIAVVIVIGIICAIVQGISENPQGCVVVIVVIAAIIGVPWAACEIRDAWKEHKRERREIERVEWERKLERDRKAAEQRKIDEENARKKAEEDKRIVTENENRSRRLEFAEKLDSEVLLFAKHHSEKVPAMIESLKDSIIKSNNYANDTKKRLEVVGKTNYQDDPHFKRWQGIKEEATTQLLVMIADLEKAWCEEPLRSQNALKRIFQEIEKKYDEPVKTIEQKF